MRFDLPILVLALIAGCVHAVREPSSEDRLTRAFSEPAGAIPEPLAFERESVALPAELSVEPQTRPASRSSNGWYGHPVVFVQPGSQVLPPVRSRVLTHPQGLPGGSTPGLLP